MKLIDIILITLAIISLYYYLNVKREKLDLYNKDMFNAVKNAFEKPFGNIDWGDIGQKIKNVFDPKELVKDPCPNGWRDDGSVCWLDTYGRGGGYPWKFGDGFNLDGAWRRCQNDNGWGNCEKYGEIIYPKCKDGYSPKECCLCEPNGGIKRIELDARTKCPYERHTKKVGAFCYIP